jgi:hypothetical protein
MSSQWRGVSGGAWHQWRRVERGGGALLRGGRDASFFRGLGAPFIGVREGLQGTVVRVTTGHECPFYLASLRGG